MCACGSVCLGQCVPGFSVRLGTCVPGQCVPGVVSNWGSV